MRCTGQMRKLLPDTAAGATHLHHAASVGVLCEAQARALERSGDALAELGGAELDGLLNHVVSVLVVHACEDVPVQLIHDAALAVRVEHLQRLLNDAAAVHLQRQRQHAPLELLHQLGALLGRACASGVSDPEVACAGGARTLGKEALHHIVAAEGGVALAGIDMATKRKVDAPEDIRHKAGGGGRDLGEESSHIFSRRLGRGTVCEHSAGRIAAATHAPSPAFAE